MLVCMFLQEHRLTETLPSHWCVEITPVPTALLPPLDPFKTGLKPFITQRSPL
jgi:hypothetical protein